LRQIVLDTETTGLEVSKGHRVIEIGCVELLERRPSGRTFHCYLNPDRAVDEGARAVHGISSDFLADKPRFRDVAAEFLEFIAGAELIAHNAMFDIGFLDNELALFDASMARLRGTALVLDTLQLAREKYPGQQNNLNALCRRLGVDVRHRELHGALVDAHLLADAYLAMTAGQGNLGFVADAHDAPRPVATLPTPTRGTLRVLRADPAELAAHFRRIETIDASSLGACLWKRLAEA